MAMTTCKECQAEVSTKAESCPKCGAKQPKRTSLLTWIAAGAFALFITQCSLSINESRQREAAREAAMSPQERAIAQETRQRGAAQSDAKWQCREFVTRSLKAPATAEFQPYTQFSAVGSGDGPFNVEGYVDAQNSFGAKMRTQFRCVLKKEGGSWRLIELKTSP